MREFASNCSSPWISLPVSFIIPRYILVFVGTFSNILLVFALFKDPLKCFRNSSSYLILNLAISDILLHVSWFVVQYWRSCLTGYGVHSLVYLPPYISCSSIATMAFDRYMSCVHPCKYRILITRHVTLSIIFFQWFLCLAVLAIEIIDASDIWGGYFRGGMALATVISAVLLYGKTAYVVNKNSRYFTNMAETSTTAQNRTQNTRLKNEKRLFTTMFLVSFITITTLAPLMIFIIILEKIYITNRRLNFFTRWNTDPIHTWFTTLFFVNFSINPFVYIWRLKNYRKTLKVIFKDVGFRCF